MGRTKLSTETASEIGRILGRTVALWEEASVPAFADFSAKDLAEFRRLEEANSIYAVLFIRFKLKDDVALGTVVSYFSKVVQQGVSLAEWGD